MRLTLLVLKQELRCLWRGGAFALATALALLCLAACLISLPPRLFANGSLPTFSVAVAGLEDDFLGNMLLEQIDELPFTDTVLLCDTQQAQALLDAGAVDILAQLPPDIEGALIYGRPASIRVAANSPWAGNIAYGLAREICQTVNTLQSAAYAYNSLGRQYFSNEAEFNRAYNSFCLKLLMDAVLRGRYLDLQTQINPYQLQMLTLLVFLSVSCCAIVLTVILARQKETGQTRRYYLRGVGAKRLLSVKLLSCLLLTTVPVLLIYFGAAFYGADLPLTKLLAAAYLSALLATPWYLLAALILRQAPYAALGASALLLLLLFLGGGFYPPYLLGLPMTALNPAQATRLLCGWILGNGFPPTICHGALGSAVCLFAAVKAWRVTLC